MGLNLLNASRLRTGEEGLMAWRTITSCFPDASICLQRSSLCLTARLLTLMPSTNAVTRTSFLSSCKKLPQNCGAKVKFCFSSRENVDVSSFFKACAVIKVDSEHMFDDMKFYVEKQANRRLLRGENLHSRKSSSRPCVLGRKECESVLYC